MTEAQTGESVVIAPQIGGNSDTITDGRANSLANLRPPWIKGQSGNPKGRPRKITNRLERLLRAKDSETGDKQVDVFVKSIFKRACSRSDFLAKEIWDRIEGPVADESASKAPVAIQIVIETVGG